MTRFWIRIAIWSSLHEPVRAGLGHTPSPPPGARASHPHPCRNQPPSITYGRHHHFILPHPLCPISKTLPTAKQHPDLLLLPLVEVSNSPGLVAEPPITSAHPLLAVSSLRPGHTLPGYTSSPARNSPRQHRLAPPCWQPASLHRRARVPRSLPRSTRITLGGLDLLRLCWRAIPCPLS